MRKKIIDEFTNLPVSRQRKWQLRHPMKDKILKDRYDNSIKGKKTKTKYMKEYNKRYYKKYTRNIRKNVNQFFEIQGKREGDNIVKAERLV